MDAGLAACDDKDIVVPTDSEGRADQPLTVIAGPLGQGRCDATLTGCLVVVMTELAPNEPDLSTAVTVPINP